MNFALVAAAALQVILAIPAAAPRCRADIAPTAVTALTNEFIQAMNAQDLIAMNSLGSESGVFESLSKNPMTQECFAGSGTYFDFTASTTRSGATWTSFTVDRVNFLRSGNAVVTATGISSVGATYNFVVTYEDMNNNCNYKVVNVVVQDLDCL